MSKMKIYIGKHNNIHTMWSLDLHFVYIGMSMMTIQIQQSIWLTSPLSVYFNKLTRPCSLSLFLCRFVKDIYADWMGEGMIIMMIERDEYRLTIVWYTTHDDVELNVWIICIVLLWESPSSIRTSSGMQV